MVNPNLVCLESKGYPRGLPDLKLENFWRVKVVISDLSPLGFPIVSGRNVRVRRSHTAKLCTVTSE